MLPLTLKNQYSFILSCIVIMHHISTTLSIVSSWVLEICCYSFNTHFLPTPEINTGRIHRNKFYNNSCKILNKIIIILRLTIKIENILLIFIINRYFNYKIIQVVSSRVIPTDSDSKMSLMLW